MFRLKLAWVWFKDSFGVRGETQNPLKGALRGALVFSSISLVLSLSLLLITVAIVSGFERVISFAVSDTQGDLVHYIGKWENLSEIQGRLSETPLKEAVERVEPFWTSQGLVVGDNAGRGILIEGRYSDTWTQEKKDDSIRIQIGKALAGYLKVNEGGRLKILMPGVLKGSIDAVVDKIVSVGMYDLENRFITANAFDLNEYLKAREPEIFAQRQGEAHGVRMFFKDQFRGPRGLKVLTDWRAKFRTFLLDEKKIAEEYLVMKTWREVFGTQFEGLLHNKVELGIMLGILVLVATLNLGATFVVLFLSREREITIMQAIGWGPRGVRNWLALLGWVLGIVFSSLAVVFSPIFGKIVSQGPWAELPESVYNIKYLPLTFEINAVIVVWIYGVLCSFGVAALMGFALSKISLLSSLSHRRM